MHGVLVASRYGRAYMEAPLRRLAEPAMKNERSLARSPLPRRCTAFSRQFVTHWLAVVRSEAPRIVPLLAGNGEGGGGEREMAENNRVFSRRDKLRKCSLFGPFRRVLLSSPRLGLSRQRHYLLAGGISWLRELARSRPRLSRTDPRGKVSLIGPWSAENQFLET